MAHFVQVALLLVSVGLLACDSPKGSAPSPTAASGEASATPRAKLPSRVVGVGGQVTEVVFALGAGSSVVGVDSSSVYPPEARALPQIGYQRAISSEGTLALGPDLILATEEAGPAAALEQLRSSGVKLVQISTTPTVAGARERIARIGELLGRQERAKELIAKLDRDVADVETRRKAAGSPPRALFLFARGAGTLMVAGRKTAADAMLELVSVQNVVSEYEGYRPLTAEAVIQKDPDLIVATRSSQDDLDLDGVLATPGVSATRAGKLRRVALVQPLDFLGFGPRTGEQAGRFLDEIAKLPKLQGAR